MAWRRPVMEGRTSMSRTTLRADGAGLTAREVACSPAGAWTGLSIPAWRALSQDGARKTLAMPGAKCSTSMSGTSLRVYLAREQGRRATHLQAW